MRFNILVMSIDNARSKTIVAHNLAGNRGVSLEHAQSLLENLPVLYQVNLLKDDAEAVVARLGKIGVKASAVPKEIDFNTAKDDTTREIAATAPEKTSPQPADAVAVPAAATGAPPPNFTYLSGGQFDGRSTVHDKRKNSRIWMIVGAAVFIGLIFLCAQVKLRFFLPASTMSNPVPGALNQKTGKNVGFHPQAGIPEEEQSRLRHQPPVTDERARQAETYADSAKACSTVNGAIAFYKIAISFNKRNMDAWYGLINALTQAQMSEEAQKAQSDMEKIFGDGVFSLARIVQRYGELLDMYRAEDGTYRIEYRSRQTGQPELLHETYLLVKAFVIQCNCMALSVFAHTDKNKGALVYLKTDPVPASYTEFAARATVTYLK